MDHVAFNTDNAAALRAYLIAKGIEVTDGYKIVSTNSRTFQVKDPEGHNIEFVQRENYRSGTRVKNSKRISRHMIHVQILYHDHPAEHHCYKDIVQFHVCYQGGLIHDKPEREAM